MSDWWWMAVQPGSLNTFGPSSGRLVAIRHFAAGERKFSDFCLSFGHISIGDLLNVPNNRGRALNFPCLLGETSQFDRGSCGLRATNCKLFAWLGCILLTAQVA